MEGIINRHFNVVNWRERKDKKIKKEWKRKAGEMLGQEKHAVESKAMLKIKAVFKRQIKKGKESTTKRE